LNPSLGDLIAIAAFAIALISLCVDIYQETRTARPKIYPPDQIVLNLSDYGSGHYYLRIGAELILANTASSRTNALFRTPSVKMWIGADVFTQLAISKANFRPVDDQEQSILRLKIDKKEPLGVINLTGGSAIAIPAYFAPAERSCVGREVGCNPLVDFLDINRLDELLSNFDSIIFTFQAAPISGGKLEVARCFVSESKKILKELKERGWSAPECKL